MKWEKYYFQKGEQYLLSEVINECDRRIREGGVIRRESKNEMVRKMEKSPSATIVWCPKTDRGWGPLHSMRTAGARSREAPSSPRTWPNPKRRSEPPARHLKTTNDLRQQTTVRERSRCSRSPPLCSGPSG